MTALTMYQMVGLFLLSVGFFGLVWRRTLIGMVISLELMINGAGLAVVAAAQLTPANGVTGQIAALFIMGIAAAEATLILAIVLVVVRRFKTSRAGEVSQMKG
ncbi:MAG: NADH-quinone oxidoreductase subunit NuoK [Deltaproteobacteria bacterium]|nr:NADH-quinone oxidoreductase subunit NuoK [Deltaproteobacteria bacterium]MBW2049455.1 NADH-quinone oxidoreductase subunit NuoK [Deltaproteobacteria bacterium]MBW2111624.1 NADH-quinone oxidoreductase subunit NuoK [Deltaproteobacteria bacterium]MBW2353993.1 NADH-quinone oxidoreductase subunit NuoK [Deltaproteobacteria bacterium]HDZ90031.1 NADH-quinone oxidoreductase subunit NuoK [Deltaproteobacteria bacterium]